MPELCMQAVNDVYTKCQLVNGDPDYDGGCAVATSFVTAYTEACAAAIAETVAKVSSGKDGKCMCDVSVEAVANATAKEYETLFAKISQELQAYACSYGTVESSYGRTCAADAAAFIIAQVIFCLRCMP